MIDEINTYLNAKQVLFASFEYDTNTHGDISITSELDTKWCIQNGVLVMSDTVDGLQLLTRRELELATTHNAYFSPDTMYTMFIIDSGIDYHGFILLNINSSDDPLNNLSSSILDNYQRVQQSLLSHVGYTSGGEPLAIEDWQQYRWFQNDDEVSMTKDEDGLDSGDCYTMTMRSADMVHRGELYTLIISYEYTNTAFLVRTSDEIL